MPVKLVTKFPSKRKGDEAVSDPFCLTNQEKWLLQYSRQAAGLTHLQQCTKVQIGLTAHH